MQLEQMIVEIIEVERGAFPRHAIAWRSHLDPELTQARLALGKGVQGNFECDVLIRLVCRRLALHDRDPQPTQQKKSFARQRKVLRHTVVDLSPAEPFAQQRSGTLEIAHDKGDVADTLDHSWLPRMARTHVRLMHLLVKRNNVQVELLGSSR